MNSSNPTRWRLVRPLLPALLVLVAACSQSDRLTTPDGGVSSLPDKDGTETLGTPSIAIAAGTGFAEGGIGMVGVDSGVIALDVPAEAAIAQVLVYWAGGTTGAAGDDTILLDGTEVQGTLIGGPTKFYRDSGVDYWFSAYRADITGLGLVAAGTNALTVTGFDFDTTGGQVDENNGCSIVVITDDGSAAALALRDGLDMAYFGFEPTLDATVPQVFAVAPANDERTAELMMMVASVGQDRPNTIVVTTSLGQQVFESALGSNDGLTWDSVVLPVVVPAGDESITVQVVSTSTLNPQGASLGWVGAGLALAAPAAETVAISGTVFADANLDGVQDPSEPGVPGVVVDLTDAAGAVASVATDGDGHYEFAVPGGSYTVAVDLADHGDSFNGDLAASFSPTTDLSVPVSGAAADVDFGFVPDADAIIADLVAGELITTGETLEYWKMVFRRALIEEESGRQASGHQQHGDRGGRGGQGGQGDHGQAGDSPGNGGWGHDENYPGAETLRGYLAQISSLYLPDPYQFGGDDALEDAYEVLRGRPRTDEGLLYQELLVTELNFVAGRGLVGEEDRLGVLIAWGEATLGPGLGNDDKDFEKDRTTDLLRALRIFEAINTGGGGGVDE